MPYSATRDATDGAHYTGLPEYVKSSFAKGHYGLPNRSMSLESRK